MFLGGFYSETLKNPSAWHSSLSQLTFECKLVPIKALICTLAHGCAFPWAVSELVPIPSSYVLTINGWFLGTTPQFLSLYVSLSFPKSHFTSILHMKTRILSTKVPTMLWVPLWVQSAFLRHHVLLCWGNLTPENIDHEASSLHRLLTPHLGPGYLCLSWTLPRTVWYLCHPWNMRQSRIVISYLICWGEYLRQEILASRHLLRWICGRYGAFRVTLAVTMSVDGFPIERRADCLWRGGFHDDAGRIYLTRDRLPGGTFSPNCSDGEQIGKLA